MDEDKYFENFLKSDLDMWFQKYTEAGEDLRQEWFDPRYNNQADLARRKWDTAQRYQLIKSGEWKKREDRTKELEAGGYSVASTLLGKQGATPSLSSKTLFGS